LIKRTEYQMRKHHESFSWLVVVQPVNDTGPIQFIHEETDEVLISIESGENLHLKFHDSFSGGVLTFDIKQVLHAQVYAYAFERARRCNQKLVLEFEMTPRQTHGNVSAIMSSTNSSLRMYQ